MVDHDEGKRELRPHGMDVSMAKNGEAQQQLTHPVKPQLVSNR
jgi:hypothetical protein